jgi:hypothetical protein
MQLKQNRNISRQDILQNVFLRCGQAGRELDVDANDKFTTFFGVLRDCHAQARISLLMTRLGWTRLRDTD